MQGLTEFLPISSSAHLILVPQVLGWDDAFLNSAEFDVMLHMGTLAALLAYFWRDLWRYFVAGLAAPASVALVCMHQRPAASRFDPNLAQSGAMASR